MKISSSTTDNNSTSAINTSSSLECARKATPASANPSGNSFLQSTAKTGGPLRVQFGEFIEEILSDVEPKNQLIEVFADLNLFIEKIASDRSVSELAKMKEEYFEDKKQFQREFDNQLKHQLRKVELTYEPIDEEDDEEDDDDDISELNLSIASSRRLRDKKIAKLKKESFKQEFLMTKINRVLESITTSDERNVEDVVRIERHYLVASNRFQAALTELRRLEDESEALHPHPCHQKGKCVISDITVEVKQSYFDRGDYRRNEYVVAVVKHDDEVYASMPICISDDIRTIRFPNKFKTEAFMDFEMRLEIHGTTFWRQQSSSRNTMFKKYGIVTFNICNTGESRQRFDMVETIKSENNPLRKKILVNIHQTMTPDVQYRSGLMVKLGKSWFEAHAVLVGHLMEISLLENQGERQSESILLDLHNFDADFIIPVVSHISGKQHTFMLKFNHQINDNDFQ